MPNSELPRLDLRSDKDERRFFKQNTNFSYPSDLESCGAELYLLMTLAIGMLKGALETLARTGVYSFVSKDFKSYLQTLDKRGRRALWKSIAEHVMTL